VHANLVVADHLNFADLRGAVPNRTLIGCHGGLDVCDGISPIRPDVRIPATRNGAAQDANMMTVAVKNKTLICARIRSNEKEISHGRVAWQTR